jgi:hypothetical protein
MTCRKARALLKGEMLHEVNQADNFKKRIHCFAGEYLQANEYQKRDENSPEQGGKPDHPATRGVFHG